MQSLVQALRPSLFWDTDFAQLDDERHASHIIHRVVERGTLEEWRATRAHYGDERMKAVVTQLRSLSPRDVAFCCAAFDLQKDDFRCCTARPFPPAPWIY